jgi:hypothetical protein
VRSIEELLESKKSRLRSRKQRLTAVGIRCADHVTPLYPQKLALTSPTGGGRSVGIVRSRTKAMKFSCSMVKTRCVVNTIMNEQVGVVVTVCTYNQHLLVSAWTMTILAEAVLISSTQCQTKSLSPWDGVSSSWG